MSKRFVVVSAYRGNLKECYVDGEDQGREVLREWMEPDDTIKPMNMDGKLHLIIEQSYGRPGGQIFGILYP